MSDDIRVVVILTDANPELLAEFANVSPRARAERMRVLATLGLGFSRGGLGAHVQRQTEVVIQTARQSLPEFEVSKSRKPPASTQADTEVDMAVQPREQNDERVSNSPRGLLVFSAISDGTKS